MKIHPLTVTFCRPEMLAYTFIQFRKFWDETLPYAQPQVISGHYPIDHDMNVQACRMISDAVGANWNDPGEDIGSAQSQNWMIQRLEEWNQISEDDLIFNLDPDSFCDQKGWDRALVEVLTADPQIAVASLISPVVWNEMKVGRLPYEEKEIAGHPCMVPKREEQFNVSFMRYRVLKEIQGIPQHHRWYGQVEAPMYQKIRKAGFYNVYLLDYMENEEAKKMQDLSFGLWKQAHVTGSFEGKFRDYVKQGGSG